VNRFKVIEQFPAYAVTRGGQVKRTGKARGAKVGRVLKHFPVVGYPAVDLRIGGKRTVNYVHRLVALTFIPNPQNRSWVNHKSGNPKNPRASNLEWVTPKGNTAHAVSTGLSPVGSRCRQAKLCTADVRDIRARLTRGERGCDLAVEYEVSRQTICSIKKGRNWRRV